MFIIVMALLCFSMNANLSAVSDHDQVQWECRLLFEQEVGEEEDPPTYTDYSETSFRVLCECLNSCLHIEMYHLLAQAKSIQLC